HVAYVILSTSSYLFLFQYSGPHRTLHSFPTRRSSDLQDQIPGARAPRDHQGCVVEPRSPARRRPRPDVGERVDDQLAAHALDDRSEEHTSELQSRGHLVCRLLLEKKKEKEKVDIDTTS